MRQRACALATAFLHRSPLARIAAAVALLAAPLALAPQAHAAADPIAVSKSVMVAVDDPTAITLEAQQFQVISLITYSIQTQPAHGTLTGGSSSYTYTPASGYTGNDTFTFTVTDIAGQTSQPGTISISVGAGLTISDDTHNEGNSGTTAFTFTVTLHGATGSAFDLPWSTADDTAKAPADYTAASGTLSFAGTDGESHSITVYANGDQTDEMVDGPGTKERFTVNLGTPSPNVAAIIDGSGTGYIAEDEGPSVKSLQVDSRFSFTDANGANVRTNGVLTDRMAGGLVFMYLEYNLSTNFGSNVSGCGSGFIQFPCPPTPLTLLNSSGGTSGTLTYTYGVWITRYIFKPYFLVSDQNEVNASPMMSIGGGVGLKDDGSRQSLLSTAAIQNFTIDMKNPSVTSVTPSATLIADATTALTLTIAYDETMDGTSTPAIAFPAENPSGTLTLASGSWLNTTTYKAVFNVTDANQFLKNVDVRISGATDAAGNTQVASTVADLFTIDMDAPVATPQSITIDEDTPAAITLGGSGAEPRTYTVVTTPQHGTFDGTTYTPAANYNGSDSFTFTATDGVYTSDPATISITINAINDRPTATSQNLGTNEDTPLAITLGGSDAEQSSLTFVVTSGPAHGTFDGTTYTPAANYHRADSFTFTANDGELTSDAATVSINIASVDDPPVAASASVTTEEETPVRVTMTATDVDDSDDALTFRVTGGPSHGTFVNGTYTPDLNYNGSDAITFVASDASGDSNTATISITVTPVDDAPQLAGQELATDEDTPLAVKFAGTDVDGDSLSYRVETAPSHGTFDGTTYTPEANYHGPDSFEVTAFDGTMSSRAALISINVMSVNDAPVAMPQSVATDEDTPLPIALTGSDVDRDPLTFAIVSAPAHGTFAHGTYTPETNYHGTDSFTFAANDGHAASAPATITIAVRSINDAPLATAQSLVTDEDTPLAIVLGGTDVDGDSLTFTVTAQPSHGTFADGTYTPNANYRGSDSFAFTASDGTATSQPAIVAITVRSVNDTPVATPQSVATDEDTPLAIALAGTDSDGDALTYRMTTQPAHGTFANGIYTPAADYHGSDAIAFTASDGTATSAPATIAITVRSINDSPTATPQSVATDEDTPLAIALAGTDVDGDALTYRVTAQPSHGTFANGIYTPAANYHGSDAIAFTASDGTATSAPATIAITVRSINDSPTATAQSVATDEDTPLAIALAGTDVDGDALTYRVTAQPAHGTFGNGIYTPAANYHGSDSILFTATDGRLTSAPATVAIDVRPVNDAPTARDQSVTTKENRPLAIALDAADVDGDPLTFKIVRWPAHGTWDGTTYRPTGYFTGSDSFAYVVSDGTLTSPAATVAITVGHLNQAPVAVPMRVAVVRDTPRAITLAAGDVDGDPLTYAVVEQPSHGRLTGSAPELRYEPSPGYSGEDVFTFVVNDGDVSSAPARVELTIGSNHPPAATAQSIAVIADVPRAITLAGTDAENAQLTFTIVAAPRHGTLTGSAPSLTYTPAPGYTGDDEFTFLVNDGFVSSEPAKVVLHVTAGGRRRAAGH